MCGRPDERFKMVLSVFYSKSGDGHGGDGDGGGDGGGSDGVTVFVSADGFSFRNITQVIGWLVGSQPSPPP